MAQQEDWMSKLQTWFAGAGIVSAIFMLGLDIKYFSTILGTSITFYRLLLLVISGACFILGSVKTLQIFSGFFKFLANIKKGKLDDTGDN